MSDFRTMFVLELSTERATWKIHLRVINDFSVGFLSNVVLLFVFLTRLMKNKLQLDRGSRAHSPILGFVREFYVGARVLP